MVLDVPSSATTTTPSSPTASDEEDELTMDFDNPKPKKKGLGRLHISHLLEMVLQDAQTRLFFKAQSVIQSEIRYYVPKPEDLGYPDKLVGEWFHITVIEDNVKHFDSQLQENHLPGTRSKRRRLSASFSKCRRLTSRRHGIPRSGRPYGCFLSYTISSR